MTDNQKVLELIEQAAKDGRTKLNLSGNQLTSLPPEIEKLTNLTGLNLANNKLTSVPLEITKLTSLTSLDLGYNKLTSLPPEIAKLTKLRALNSRKSIDDLTARDHQAK